MCNTFRLLKATEIECRVAQCSKNKNGEVWASFLLYKDARVDQRIMDDTFGAMNWQATYEIIDEKLFCKVSVWDSEKQCWISKMNVGTESNTEKEKGQASDALKRACFTWGLGVELYSSPKIFIKLEKDEYEVSTYNNKETYKCNLYLSVNDIEYDDNRKVSYLTLKDNRGTIKFKFSSKGSNAPKNANEGTIADAFTSDDGKVLRIGDSTWKYAVNSTAEGKTCDDGTPIPIWVAEKYNIPDEVMRVFIEEVKKRRAENGHTE